METDDGFRIANFMSSNMGQYFFCCLLISTTEGTPGIIKAIKQGFGYSRGHALVWTAAA
jgi:hypothetical protein